jgi:hypothetical protein
LRYEPETPSRRTTYCEHAIVSHALIGVAELQATGTGATRDGRIGANEMSRVNLRYPSSLSKEGYRAKEFMSGAKPDPNVRLAKDDALPLNFGNLRSQMIYLYARGVELGIIQHFASCPFQGTAEGGHGPQLRHHRQGAEGSRVRRRSRCGLVAVRTC